MKRYTLIYIMIFLSLSHITMGQSLDSLLSGILAEEPGITAAALNYEADLAGIYQTGYLPDPEIGIGFFVSPVETRVGPQQFRAGVTQMFPWKGTLEAQRNVKQITAQLGREKMRMRQLDVIFQGKMAWYELYELKGEIALEKENIRMYDALESFTLSKVESGEGSLADVLRIQLKREESLQRIRELENRKQAPVSVINALLNRPDTALFDPTGSPGDLMALKTDINLDSLLAVHPSIRMLEIRQEKASQEIRLNDLERKPSFGIGLDYIVVGERDVADLEDNGKDIIMPRVTARVPLNMRKYDAASQEEELRIVAAEKSKETILRSYESVIRKALTKYQDAELKLAFYDGQREKTRAAVDILQSAYSSEGKGFDEMLRLRIDLTNYDIKTFRAGVDQYRSLAQIEHLLISQIEHYE